MGRTSQRGQDDGGPTRARPQRGGQQPVERARRGVRRPEALEEDGDGGGAVGVQRIGPSQILQRGIERGTAGAARGVADTGHEEGALRGLHQRSAPRSRRRRAMMLRWISALPP